MREIINLCWRLLVIALIAGLALGVVHAVTEEPIAEQAKLAAEAARRDVLPVADRFEQNEGSDIYLGFDASGSLVGYVATGVCKGFGGEIEVTVGVGPNGVIQGISVGGSNFSETAGLGAKTKDAAWREQFIGQSDSVAITKDGGQIDAIASATISSRAVADEVDRLLSRINAFRSEVQ